jgi:hypothetical protein
VRARWPINLILMRTMRTQNDERHFMTALGWSFDFYALTAICTTNSFDHLLTVPLLRKCSIATVT